ncbi:hypothetical protein NP233_g11426 [Leucocoprinus birnbaumii]|uniref:Uncharacterized protein n=1 Tax=Leucocoprinus birnbaumii TaxID=56174 RepID=A0AAD5YQY9_9AGAR|nr:hypothetical protein NP233_g11426 [Leucocoprinus birnbaumii]
MHADDESDGGGSQAAPPFRALVEKTIDQQLDDDERELQSEGSEPRLTHPAPPAKLSIELAKLFNFTDISWISSLTIRSTSAVSEETHLYELLSADAAGDDGDEIELDGTVEQVLFGI